MSEPYVYFGISSFQYPEEAESWEGRTGPQLPSSSKVGPQTKSRPRELTLRNTLTKLGKIGLNGTKGST